MSTTSGVSNKIKGKWKQVEGGVNQQAGKGMKGGMQKIEGKIQDTVGDIQLNNSNPKRNRPRNRDTV